MARQPNLTMTLRTLVMLSCLIAIPAVAVSGKSLPEMVKGLVGSADAQPQPVADQGITEGVAWNVTPTTPAAPPQPVPSGQCSIQQATPQCVVAPDTIVPAAVMPASHREPVCEVAPPIGSPVDSPAPAKDAFSQVEQRLRQLGATYYLLESWGQREQLYRFCCRVAVAGSPNYTRYFESTAADPLAAMGHVLSDVEAWRGKR